MRVEFNQLPNNARVWVYAASNTLSNSQKELIQAAADKFTEEWTAHQMPLSASFKIINDVFLVFGVDLAKHDISGCGIDKSIHLVQQWEQQLGINLFNRLQIEFEQNGNIAFGTKGKLAELLTDGLINPQTIFYNKLVANVGELNTQFCIPLVDSWVYKQLAKQSV
ncbi:MAG: hypothetical protein KBG11_09095 [Bacteroidia bacterium]|nr:hypothetical protein [Bacteroidia bacterium]